MKPSIASVLESIRNHIASSVDSDVFLGAPDDSVSGVYIFPFHIREDPVIRNTRADRTQDSQFHAYVIGCLLMTNPPSDFETLSQGLEYLHSHPLVDLEDERGQITMSNNSAEELSRVFLSSGIVYRLAVGFDVQFTCK